MHKRILSLEIGYAMTNGHGFNNSGRKIIGRDYRNLQQLHVALLMQKRIDTNEVRCARSVAVD
jgi:hypothetical protein